MRAWVSSGEYYIVYVMREDEIRFSMIFVVVR